MHNGPTPIFHRDIRWPNVVQCADDSSKWFLVDWEDAASPPTTPAPHLDRQCHSPAVYQENHGPEIDIWSVGMLINEIPRSILGLSPGLRVLADALQSNSKTATQALENLQTLRSAPIATGEV
jgi:hypothetical protein